MTTFPTSTWPPLDIVNCHTRLWQHLPDSSFSSPLTERTEAAVKATYSALSSLLHPKSAKSAIFNGHGDRALSHADLYRFVRNFRLPVAGRKPAVVLALPNGPLLAVACIAVSAYYTAVPVNVSGTGAEQFLADVRLSGAKTVLVLPGDVERLGINGRNDLWKDVQVLLVKEHKDRLTFDVKPLNSSRAMCEEVTENGPDDVCIVLFTSGTSGTKKRVPVTLHNIVTGAAAVIQSWGLKPEDVCLNMMPLNHVGGIVRNLFAPILSGGTTICCGSFDPNLFWDLVEDCPSAPTWYYASPTMHSALVSESKNRPSALSKSEIRLVCNAAGGLLHSLAVQIRDTFDCVVLPSYGMTECMPIATPPPDYALQRPGTSGVAVGPSVSIRDDKGEYKPAGEIGFISVRGPCVFGGYLRPDNTIDRSCFDKDGWFNTGDLGYLDEDGYLYITGRAKEVINRGGELISPFEVEEAIMAAAKRPESVLYNRVMQAVAISVPHEVLQEVVGVVLVTPPRAPRPDLRQLQQALKESLQSVKLPMVVVYMDTVPMVGGTKISRTKISQGLSLDPIDEKTPAASRHFNAQCDASQKIVKQPCYVDCQEVVKRVGEQLEVRVDVRAQLNQGSGYPEVFLAPLKDDGMRIEVPEDFLRTLGNTLDGYLVPTAIKCFSKPIPGSAGSIDLRKLHDKTEKEDSSKAEKAASGSLTEQKLHEIFVEILQCDDINSGSDFFELGGDSLKAGRLFSMIRAEFGVRLPIDVVFKHSVLSQLAEKIDSEMPSAETKRPGSIEISEKELPELPDEQGRYSSTRVWLLIFQLIPICIMYPLKRAFQYTLLLFIFAHFLAAWQPYGLVLRLANLIAAIVLAHTATQLIAPLTAITVKWLVIGRYSEGLYPLWGPYHTRWWIVQKAIAVGGRGVFNKYNCTRVLYYRLLGAQIGRGVTIDRRAVLGEYDLLVIGDGVTLDQCTVRPFAVERHSRMYLGRIVLGRRAAVGLQSIVAAGATVPADTCIGPNSSSWELADAAESNRSLSASQIPEPHPVLALLVLTPLKALVSFVGMLPWMLGLLGLVMEEPAQSPDMVQSVIAWFASPGRMGFHFLARALSASAGPVFFFLAAVAAKHLLDALCGGPLRPGQQRTQLRRLRAALLADLFPAGSIAPLSELFGSHYEATSIAMRMLGARVGKRVYWPGTGPALTDFDLLRVGDDVVFGSRSHLVASDSQGSEYVTIGAGAMVADRVVMLPGAVAGRRTLLGSGALARRNAVHADDSVWVGSKGGSAICLSTGTNSPATSTSTPFGRAFYQRLAPYYVFPQPLIALYATLTTVAVALYWNAPTVGAIQLASRITPRFAAAWYRPLPVFALIAGLTAPLLSVLAVVALALTIAAKYALLGTRKPGRYCWDASPYCQRWQLFLTLERLRRHCFGGAGLLSLLTGTHWLVLYYRLLGAQIGRDVALFAGGKATVLFTEPDLLDIGDGVVADDVSLVGHINSRGVFELRTVKVGAGAVLRSGARVLAGGEVGAGAWVGEHSLVVAGDVVERGGAVQGWPVGEFGGRWEGEGRGKGGKGE
ncbi:hypothetical protein EDC01DRAFT_700371 [Geopyxis carbonaria]|nr:hypothetical protein EDC01DRAFT_700371 [Geopyxis carbonaria]